jgi:hypothetical protein
MPGPYVETPVPGYVPQQLERSQVVAHLLNATRGHGDHYQGPGWGHSAPEGWYHRHRQQQQQQQQQVPYDPGWHAGTAGPAPGAGSLDLHPGAGLQQRPAKRQHVEQPRHRT